MDPVVNPMLNPNAHLGYPLTTMLLFGLMILGFLALDLFAHRQDKPVSVKSALTWTAIWIAAAFGFAGYLYLNYDLRTGDTEYASLFLTGYMLEKVLSVDNLMVFVAIFSAFSIPEGYRHRVLFYGVVGAILFRLIFVFAGSAMYALGPWVEFVFAAVIAWSAVQMLKSDGGDDEISDYSNHFSVRWCGKLFAVWPKLYGHNFFVSKAQVDNLLADSANATVQVSRNKSWYATPLFVCLIVMNVADVMFSFDSVPAIIAVTKEPLLVYSAMIFAILGLRQLYFVLEAMEKYLAYLAKAVIALLFFIAFKISLSAAHHFEWTTWEITPNQSLMVVVGVLAIGVVASLLFPPKAGDKTNAE